MTSCVHAHGVAPLAARRGGPFRFFCPRYLSYVLLHRGLEGFLEQQGWPDLWASAMQAVLQARVP